MGGNAERVALTAKVSNNCAASCASVSEGLGRGVGRGRAAQLAEPICA